MTVTRRQFLTVSSALLASGALSPLRLGAQAAPAAPVTKFQDLRRSAGIFTGRGGTIGWLITPDNTVVVDSQYPDTAKICLDGLKSRASHPIDFLLNTHHHVDHTAGNGVFRPAVGRIVAQRGEPALQRAAAAQAHTLPEQVYPDMTFSTNWKMVLATETVSATYHGPAHTGADIVVRFEDAGVVHMGDLVWNHLHPFIDRPAGASVVNWVKVLEAVLNEDPADTVYIFGHGKASAGVTGHAADLRHFRDYFTAVIEYVQRGIRAGESKAEIAKLPALRGFEDYEAPAPPRVSLASVLEVTYEELTAPERPA
ncbi:MAG TPA: MBL fold metallo-hydrolase [Vicinamibacterales bacterium]|nr:MBL fold metallo-hydrolase [Vicinamibacterales bacterium]